MYCICVLACLPAAFITSQVQRVDIWIQLNMHLAQERATQMRTSIFVSTSALLSSGKKLYSKMFKIIIIIIILNVYYFPFIFSVLCLYVAYSWAISNPAVQFCPRAPSRVNPATISANSLQTALLLEPIRMMGWS